MDNVQQYRRKEEDEYQEDEDIKITSNIPAELDFVVVTVHNDEYNEEDEEGKYEGKDEGKDEGKVEGKDEGKYEGKAEGKDEGDKEEKEKDDKEDDEKKEEEEEEEEAKDEGIEEDTEEVNEEGNEEVNEDDINDNNEKVGDSSETNSVAPSECHTYTARNHAPYGYASSSSIGSILPEYRSCCIHSCVCYTISLILLIIYLAAVFTGHKKTPNL